MSTTRTTSAAQKLPWLLYAYPWMPFPRRVAIYLAEKRISPSAVQVVHVTDPQDGNQVVASQAHRYPSRPEGSLPVLMIGKPSSSSSPSLSSSSADNEFLCIRQSMAIIEYLEEATANDGLLATIRARPLRTGSNALGRARDRELLGLAEELTVMWNPVRTFGTGAGTLIYPEGAKEMLRWVHRTLDTVNRLISERHCNLSDVADDDKPVSVAEIVLFQFLDFVNYCYGVDVTQGSGKEKTDVYGRAKTEVYNALRQWYLAFKQRQSTRRDGEGEIAAPEVLARMQNWHEGSL